MADKSDSPMDQTENTESSNQYNALLKSHVLGIDDPYLLQNFDEDENSPGIMSSSHLHIMRSNEKSREKKKAVFERPFSTLDNVVIPMKS